MLCKAKINIGEVWDHFCKANFTLKYGPLTSPVTLSELRKHQKIFSMANLVCPYPPKKTIISGGTVFAVFDLGQIVYQGPVTYWWKSGFEGKIIRTEFVSYFSVTVNDCCIPATDGVEFWISCKQPAFLSSFGLLQVIPNKRSWCWDAAYVTAG